MCTSCKWFTYLNSSTSFKATDSLYLLTIQGALWMVVKLFRAWQDFFLLFILKTLLYKILKKNTPKVIYQSSFGGIKSLTALTATLAIVGTALDLGVQITHFVEIWHKNASLLLHLNNKLILKLLLT